MARTQIDAQQFLDPVWRLSNLYTIIDKEGQEVPFRPNWAQQELLDQFHTRNIILKARQLGFTTVCCLIYLDDCIFNPNVRAAVIAHRLDDAKVIFRDKVKFPFEHLPDQLRERVSSKQNSADTLTMSNNSSIRVSTSTRSGTVNWLHVSEYGKICAQFPNKAQEIRTGAFPSAERGNITIESTAEGEEGDFFDKSMSAQSLADQGAELGRLDYRFFFFPWWREPSYRLSRAATAQSPEDDAYFSRLEAEQGIVLDEDQKHWYLKQEIELGGDLKREYPATPTEAFEQALEGAYFADQMAFAAKQGRIGKFPVNPAFPVNTFWDLGRNDFTTIWLEQDIDSVSRFVGYYENSGEFIEHYLDWLQDWREANGSPSAKVQFGKHYLPHDGDRQSLWLPEGTMAVMERLGFFPEIVQRPQNKIETINTARRKMMTCAFDEDGCKTGLKRLKSYRKEWDDQRGVWRNSPRHDEASHGADGFMTFTSSDHIAMPGLVPPKRDRYRSETTRSRRSFMSA